VAVRRNSANRDGEWRHGPWAKPAIAQSNCVMIWCACSQDNPESFPALCDVWGKLLTMIDFEIFGNK